MSTAVTTVPENRISPEAFVENGSAPQSTALIKSASQPGNALLSLAEKSGNPMQFISEMGKQMAFSGMLGLKKPEQGATLLLICMTENTKPLAFINEYHLMDDGKITKKADWVLSRFVEIGGKFKILDDGTDTGQPLPSDWKAEYEFSFGGNTRTVSYSMADAQREELVKPKSRWVKNPASMLRARVITNGVRMVAPQVFAGFNTAEELEGQDFAPPPSAPTGNSATRKKAAATVVTPVAPATNATTVSAADDSNVIDAEVEPATTAKEDPPFDGGTTTAAASTDTGDSANDITTVLMEIELTLGQIGMTKADLEAGMKKKNPAFTSLDSLGLDQAKALLEKLRAKKQASQAG